MEQIAGYCLDTYGIPCHEQLPHNNGRALIAWHPFVVADSWMLVPATALMDYGLRADHFCFDTNCLSVRKVNINRRNSFVSLQYSGFYVAVRGEV